MRSALARAADEAARAIDKTVAGTQAKAEEVAERLRNSVAAPLGEVEQMLTEAGKRTEGTASATARHAEGRAEDALGRFAGATEESAARQARSAANSSRPARNCAAAPSTCPRKPRKRGRDAPRRGRPDQGSAGTLRLIGKAGPAAEVTAPCSPTGPRDDRRTRTRPLRTGCHRPRSRVRSRRQCDAPRHQCGRSRPLGAPRGSPAG